VVSACLGLLRGCHDRSRVPAAQLLLLLSRQPALVPRLEPCLNTLLALLAESGEQLTGFENNAWCRCSVLQMSLICQESQQNKQAPLQQPLFVTQHLFLRSCNKQ
jgi:hypothetical protein